MNAFDWMVQLSGIAIALAAAPLFGRFMESHPAPARRRGTLLGVGLLVAFAVLLNLRHGDWHDDQRLWLATVAVNQFVFKQPVSMGDLLSFYARVERIGKTSVTVNIEVFAERNPADLHVVKVTEANVTYVAIDGQGRPRPIPRG